MPEVSYAVMHLITCLTILHPGSKPIKPVLKPHSGMPIGIPDGTLGWLYLPIPPP